jgi:hypothetical protein
VSLTHRFRLDKDNLAIRRNEIDATTRFAKHLCGAQLSAAQSQRHEQLEDLADREEARIGARIAMSRSGQLFGSTVVDLTDKKEAPGVLSDGFEPVRHRLGSPIVTTASIFRSPGAATISWSATHAPTTTFSYGWRFAIWAYKDCVSEEVGLLSDGSSLRTVNRASASSILFGE